MDFQLSTPPIFSFRECRWFLDRNYDDIMHRVTEASVIKPFRVGEPYLWRTLALWAEK